MKKSLIMAAAIARATQRPVTAVTPGVTVTSASTAATKVSAATGKEATEFVRETAARKQAMHHRRGRFV